MSKIIFDDFVHMMSTDVITHNSCIEVDFSLDDDLEYSGCCLGKMPADGKDIYWYGLVADGSQAYDYSTLEQFLNATILRGQSLRNMWDKISISAIDSCPVEIRLSHYLHNNGFPRCGKSRVPD